ncbi:MAG TPA: hypothetical protein VGV17_13560 [Bosea sp. (in: a-proteobacteria)]|uniref:hypothetical protein n=1 Tax=Bosea sp. (in: a-proteobacteria) TaxID=1871050 RepID=UPI002DDD72FC|nr:hypothetical protein [Bosea sp. (in: a-proteobacteria)]HEV2554781.1 hypothetical protein [Bosea sp. (in: a-proteobacteria)]
MTRSRRAWPALVLLACVGVSLSCLPEGAGALPAGSGSAPAGVGAPTGPETGKMSEASARRIAWGSGIDHIEDVVLADGRWQIAGRDRSGVEITVDIHVGDGRLLDQTGLLAN